MKNNQFIKVYGRLVWILSKGFIGRSGATKNQYSTNVYFASIYTIIMRYHRYSVKLLFSMRVKKRNAKR